MRYQRALPDQRILIYQFAAALELVIRMGCANFIDKGLNMQCSSYQHILGNNLVYNDIDTCFYFDGISKINSIDSVIVLAKYLFNYFSQNIDQVAISDNVKFNTKNRSMKWLEKNGKELELSDFNNILTIEFFPTKRKTIDDTWMPLIFLSITFGDRDNSAFFCIRNNNLKINNKIIYDKVSNFCNFCAGYIYEFPSAFSSLGYRAGIIIVPSSRALGRYGDVQASRLANCRDNTEIGISGSGGRKFYSVCDGYVRDVYPIMILSECHRRREINGLSMVDYISKHLPVAVEQVGSKTWVRIENKHLLKVQKAFDKHQITLSGARIEH